MIFIQTNQYNGYGDNAQCPGNINNCIMKICLKEYKHSHRHYTRVLNYFFNDWLKSKKSGNIIPEYSDTYT